MREVFTQGSYLAASVLFILGLKSLTHPDTARRGMFLAEGGMFAAIVGTLVGTEIISWTWIIAGLALGSIIGAWMAVTVPMTAMPQLVALFNGVGGGAAAIVAFLELKSTGGGFPLVASLFTVVVGSISFSGSVVTFLKLQELITTRPVVIPGHPVLFGGSLLGALVLAVVAFAKGGAVDAATYSAIGMAVLALAAGVLFVLPVGGADVPIVISLLNAFTGITVAASGYVLDNVLLLIAGTLVGASGTILTRLMAKAMGRPITSTLFGALRGGSTAGSTTAGADRPVRSASPDDVAILLAYSRKVIIVPGYGLAVAQAQHTVRELADLLAARDVEVLYGIHPVAGRMPGHMNVLLAEANVPYEQLKEMDEVNPQFATTDVVLVIGANDVVNPAARQPGTPISGMPILDVDQAQNVIFLKRSMRPGFAGIDNELLYQPNTSLLFGDAKDSLTKVVSALKNL